jgi:uncharacterized protein YoxC
MPEANEELLDSIHALTGQLEEVSRRLMQLNDSLSEKNRKSHEILSAIRGVESAVQAVESSVSMSR